MPKRWLLTLLLFIFIPVLLFGQSSELSGTVKDAHGLAIKKAKIELRNQDNGFRGQILTTNQGRFHFRGLKPGVYQVTVQAPEFKTLTRDGIHVGAKQRIWLDLCLQK
jgi:protocatechuate 3,4-dioxygenase beta subunit